MANDFLQTDTPRRQRGPRLTWLLLLAGAFTLYLLSGRQTAALEGWGADFEAALQEAARTNRPVLAAFYMAGCPYCAAMDRTVLSARAVQPALSDFIPVRISLDDRPDLADRYGVSGVPAFAILDSDGKVMAQTSGYQPVEAFLAFLESAGRDRTSSALGHGPADY